MTHVKTYTIPSRLLSRVRCGSATGQDAGRLVSLYWEFEEIAGKGWQLFPVSAPAMSCNDVTDGIEMSVECELYGIETETE